MRDPAMTSQPTMTARNPTPEDAEVAVVMAVAAVAVDDANNTDVNEAATIVGTVDVRR